MGSDREQGLRKSDLGVRLASEIRYLMGLLRPKCTNIRLEVSYTRLNYVAGRVTVPS